MSPSTKRASMMDHLGVPAHASFCQVADPSTEADEEDSSLVLPEGFVRRFYTYLQEILTLEAPNGQVWKASLEADREKGLRITGAGWREVARNLHVQSGDLLVFDLVSKGHLQIFIYEGEDMCEKDIYNKRKASENGARNRSATGMLEHGKKQKILLRDRKKVYHDSSNGNKNLEDDKKVEAFLRTMVDKENDTRLTEDSMVDKENDTRLTEDYRKEDCLISEPKSATGRGKHDSLALVPYKTSSLYQTERLNLCHKKNFNMQDFHRLYPELHKETQDAFKNALAHSSNNPFTILVMIHSNVCHGFKLAFPSSFAKQHMSAEAAQVVLIDEDNKAWSVTWLGYNNPNLSFSGGWKHFVMDHRLKCGDICILELISTKAVPTFKVYIFQVSPNDATTIRNEIPAKLSSALARNGGDLPKLLPACIDPRM